MKLGGAVASPKKDIESKSRSRHELSHHHSVERKSERSQPGGRASQDLVDRSRCILDGVLIANTDIGSDAGGAASEDVDVDELS